MTPSIKARLLLGMLGGMAVLMAVFAVVVYGVLVRSLVEGFDAVLVSTARTIESSIEQKAERIEAEIGEGELPEFQPAARPDYFELWREDGRLLARSPSLKGMDLDRFEGLIGSPIFRRVRLPDGRPGRSVGLLFVPKIDDEIKEVVLAQRVLLVVARETATLDSEIAFLRWLLAAATGGTVLLALLVGTVVVRQGLRPLDALVAHIAAIRQDELSTLLPAKRMPAEVAPVVERLNDLLRRLEEAFRRERAFTADAAHELRTPLTGMRSTLEVALARPRTGDDYRQAMTECLHIIRHMQEMVDNLLTLARLEGGQTALRIEPVIVGELLQPTLRPFADKARSRGIAIESRVSGGLVCTTDHNSLAMIFTILLANAAEYTNDGGRIEIVARRLGASVELTIANTGCRLSQEEARHVFERFWRGDASRTGTGIHCGLGLPLVHRAAASIGGTVTADVDDGMFTVRLMLPAVPRP